MSACAMSTNREQRTYNINVPVKVQPHTVYDLLIDGDWHYWVETVRWRTGYSAADDADILTEAAKGEAVWFYVDTQLRPFQLDGTKIQRGLELMARDYPHHWHDVVTQNQDAITGDVFLQLCLFGEVRYG